MRKIILVLITIFLLSGCAGMYYAQRYDPAADFSQLRTYAFLPLPEKSKQDTLLLMKNMRYAVNSVLQSKGFTQEPDSPDFLVAIHAVTEQRVDVEQYGYAYSPGYIDHPAYYDPSYPYDYHRRYGHLGPEYYEYRSGVNVYEYTVGNLIVDIVKREPRELIWRGSAQGELKEDFTQEGMKKIVTDILAGFPPPASQ